MIPKAVSFRQFHDSIENLVSCLGYVSEATISLGLAIAIWAVSNFYFFNEEKILKSKEKRHFTWLASIAFVFCTSGCKLFKSETKTNEAVTEPPVQAPQPMQAQHTPPFNFSIKFDAVSKEIADDFRDSYKNPNSFTGSLKITDFVSEDLKVNSVNGENPGPFLNPATKEAVMRKAVRSYIEAANTWLKLECLSLDDPAARAQPPVFRFTGPRAKFVSAREAGQYGIDPASLTSVNRGQLEESLKAKGQSLGTHCRFSWRPAPGERGENLSMDTLLKPEIRLSLAPFDETGKTYRWHQFSIQTSPNEFFQAGAAKILRVGGALGAKGPDGRHFSGEAAGAPLSAKLRVSGNYIFPMATHSTSKAFVNPVMKFDPSTGNPVAFYDYAMLFIESLDESKGLVLTSVVSPELAKRIKDPGTRSSVGTLYPLIPTKVDQFISWRELPASTPYWLYERLPIGSQHFMLNAIWSEPPGTPFGALMVIPGVTKAELKRLVLGGNLFLNPYDHERETDASPDAMNFLSRFKKAGDCAPTNEVISKDLNIPAGQPVSHELILGGKNGREFWQNRPNLLLIQDDGAGNYCAASM